VAASIADQTGILQPACGFRHALSPYAKDFGEEFLREQHFSAQRSIETHQQAAAQALIYRVMTGTDCVLKRLRDQRLGIAKQQLHHWTRAIELLFDDFRL
jgi:hypothetical protein